MSLKDNLGDRMKRYERNSLFTLLPKSPVLIRVDGKSFHTYTKGCNKPFDLRLVNAMTYAAQMTAEQMQGFKLAYTQSDECTFMITDFDTFETDGWFNYEVNKIVSITASMFSGWFNDAYRGDTPAFFDARAFNVPYEDSPNAFIWRQQDWERNSIQMLARAHFSHKECENKKVPDLHEMLHTKGVNWAKLSDQLKNGTFVEHDKSLTYNHETWFTLKERLDALCLK